MRGDENLSPRIGLTPRSHPLGKLGHKHRVHRHQGVARLAGKHRWRVSDLRRVFEYEDFRLAYPHHAQAVSKLAKLLPKLIQP